MSNREIAINIINQIPEYKLAYVVDMLESVKNLIIEEVEPDEWDLQMITDAERVNDGVGITLEDLAKDLDLNV